MDGAVFMTSTESSPNAPSPNPSLGVTTTRHVSSFLVSVVETELVVWVVIDRHRYQVHR